MKEKEIITMKLGTVFTLDKYDEAYELKRELQYLYAEQRDAQSIADYLKSYYEPHEGRQELFPY